MEWLSTMWEKRYARALLVTDAVIIVVVVIGSQLLRYGTDYDQSLLVEPTDEATFRIGYTLISAVLIVAWLTALSIFETRSPTMFGGGPAEYKSVINATLATFGILAIVAFSFRSQVGRGYVFIALPVGLVLLVLARFLWRRYLQRQRAQGRALHRALVMGERAKSQHLAQQLQEENAAGFDVIGAVTERGTAEDILPGIPVVSDYDGLMKSIDELKPDVLIVTAADTITPQRLKNISWELENRHIDLVVAASLTDIAGPRIHMRPVVNLPLIHVEFPEFSGRKYLAKRLFDVLSTALGLLIVSPVMFVVAGLIKLTSPGPVLFKQERVGADGKRFNMLKFRSMVVDAEERLEELRDLNEGGGVLFKIKDDPRITRLGKTLRKYSLDELPQLINVLRGDMSLVGPRPPLVSEVEEYEEWVHRRLLVKPGITGLWQVSGRSDLSWEDSVRLDLYYVENWSFTGDLLILLRTVKTVVAPDGAY